MSNLESNSQFSSFESDNREEVKQVKERIEDSQKWIDGTRNVNKALSNAKVNLGLSVGLHGTLSLPLALPAESRKALPPSDDK